MTIKLSAKPRSVPGLSVQVTSTIQLANKYLWVSLNDGSLCRYSVDDYVGVKDGHGQSEAITKKNAFDSVGALVERLFVDSTSYHCIACVDFGEAFYINHNSSKAIYLEALRDVHIRSVCFTDLSNDFFTGKILIGTQQGIVIEGTINHSTGLYSFRRIYTVEDSEPILGIQSITVIYQKQPVNLVLLVTTKRLYEFFGCKGYEDTFAKYSREGLSGLRYQVPIAGPSAELLVVNKVDGGRYVVWANSTGIILSPIAANSDEDSYLQFPPTVIQYPRPSSDLMDGVIGERQANGISDARELLSSNLVTKARSFLRRPSDQIPKSAVAIENYIFLLFDSHISVVNSIVGKQVG